MRLAIIVSLAVGVVAGGRIVQQTVVTAELESRVVDILNGSGGGYAAPVGDPCAKSCPPRALAASAVILTLEPGHPDRAARLALAEQRLTRALETRPKAGGWWTWLAYARAVRSGVTEDALHAFETGYGVSPFLAMEGAWRVRFGALNWERLRSDTRRHVVEEAVWLRDIDQNGVALKLDPGSDPRAVALIATALATPQPGLVPHRRSGSPGGVRTAGE